MPPSELSSRALLDFATDLVWQTGQGTLAYFQGRFEIETKADETPVTVADREAERKMRAHIRKTFPNHAVVGEEYDVEGPENASYRWIIDPIDGTRSFIRGVPLYGVMAGLERDGEPIVGAIAFPAMSEVIAGAIGEGCFWNGRQARVSTCDDLSQALLLYTDPEHFALQGKQEPFDALRKATSWNRSWGDCYGHCLVATGRAEIMLDPIMNLWDCAPLLPIVQEAGGRFSDWRGNPSIHNGDALSTNAALSKTVLREIHEHWADFEKSPESTS